MYKKPRKGIVLSSSANGNCVKFQVRDSKGRTVTFDFRISKRRGMRLRICQDGGGTKKSATQESNVGLSVVNAILQTPSSAGIGMFVFIEAGIDGFVKGFGVRFDRPPSEYSVYCSYCRSYAEGVHILQETIRSLCFDWVEAEFKKDPVKEPKMVDALLKITGRVTKYEFGRECWTRELTKEKAGEPIKANG